jgi:hypothetical protein
VDDANAVVPETTWGQGTVDLGLVADKEKRSHAFIGLDGPHGALDDDPATVVATHDIHSNPHNKGVALKMGNAASGQGQAPAVTVMIWRPL